jgi:hypothetical protein
MAVARFIIASIAIALVAAQANIDCNQAPAPTNADMNYYVPSDACKASNANVEACYTQWDQCLGNSTNCDLNNACLASVIVCLDNIPAPAELNMTSPCYAWNESFSNVKMYLDMGGAYTGSGLQAACNYAACTYIGLAPKFNNNATCAVPLATCAAAPKAPPKFVLTFGGDWDSLLGDASKAEALKVALQQGIARLLQLAAYAIRVLSYKSGSLLVEFAVLDPSVDGATIAATLQGAVGNAAVLQSAFTELAGVAGFDITLESVAAAPDSGVTLAPTPVPGTPNPAGPTATPTPTPATPSSSASTVSAVAAVALVAMSLLF